GATYYTLLTGQPPFHDTQTAVQLMYMHCHGPIPEPRSVNPALPETCSRIVARAMAKLPGQRYQSTGEMTAHLQAVIAALSGQLPVVATMPEVVRPPGPDAGGSLSSRRRARQPERRQVTVLVCGCGLFESEAYLEFDAEDQAKVVRAFQQACETA